MFSNSRSTVIMGLFSASVAASGLALGQAEDDDTIRNLVSRLDLESYKTTIRGLTKFGDRRQGTERNRQAVDWIEAWLQAVGCDNTQRISYTSIPSPGHQGRADHRRWQTPI